MDLTGQVCFTAQDLAAELTMRRLVSGERRFTPEWPIGVKAELSGDDAGATVVTHVLAVLPERLVYMAGNDPLWWPLVVALLSDLLGCGPLVLLRLGTGLVVTAEVTASLANAVSRRLSWLVACAFCL